MISLRRPFSITVTLSAIASLSTLIVPQIQQPAWGVRPSEAKQKPVTTPLEVGQIPTQAPIQIPGQVPTPITDQPVAQELNVSELPAMPPGDPELGTVRLQDVEEFSSEEETFNDAVDSELGILRLREVPEFEPQTATTNYPVLFLYGGISYFRSDNLFLEDRDPVNEQLVGMRAGLWAVPSLGPATGLIASVEGDLFLYGDRSYLNYTDLSFRFGVYQYLFENTYAEAYWRNRQLFDRGTGDRFLDDHSLHLEVGRRDYLARDLQLDSEYQFRVAFAEPEERSKISHTLSTTLTYTIAPDLETGLDYRLILTDFTQQNRNDVYNELVAFLDYEISRYNTISAYGGFSFGNSSEDDVDFDSFIFGLSWNFSVSLF